MSKQLSRYISDESAMLALGQSLARLSGEEGLWIYLSGELGAGKTTLVRGFMREMGYHDRVKSPTYTLVESYEIIDSSARPHIIYHFDFYRINSSEELLMLGLEEYFKDQAICLVEWPQNALEALPTPDILLHLQPQLSGRQVTMESKSMRGLAILEQLNHG